MTNLVTLTLIFMLFVFVALFWYQLAGISMEEGMVASAITIMLLVFGCAKIGKAGYAYIISVIFSAVGIVAFFLNIGMDKRTRTFSYRLKSFLSPSLIIITGVFLYTVVFFRGSLFTYPDEVYQWGNAVKYMVQTGSLPYGENFTGDAVTFSICTTFQYFFAGIGKFKESNTFIANFLLTFIPVMLPCSKKGWNEWKKVLAYAILVFLSLNLISYIKYYTLLQDYVLPMWAGGVIAWLLWRKEEKINWILLFFSAVLIAAMKSLVGPLFVCMIILVAFLICYFGDCSDNIKDIHNIRKIRNRKYLIFLPMLITPVLLNQIWVRMAALSSGVIGRGSGTASKEVLQIFFSIIDKLFAVLDSKTDAMPFMSYVIYFGLYLFIVLFLKRVLVKKKNQTITILTLYIVGAILYLGVMFYAYLKVFSASDSSAVAGLDRYLAYYMLIGVPVILYAFFVCDETCIKKTHTMKILMLTVAIACLYSTSGNFTRKATSINRTDDDSWNLRVKTKNQIKELKKLIQDDGHIFIIGKLKTNNIKMLTYEFGQQYVWYNDSYTMDNRNDEYQTLINAAKYPQILTESDYKYVWFINPDEQKKEYEYLRYYFGFESTEDGDVYEICEQNGTYKFKYLGNVPGPTTKDGTGN